MSETRNSMQINVSNESCEAYISFTPDKEINKKSLIDFFFRLTWKRLPNGDILPEPLFILVSYEHESFVVAHITFNVTEGAQITYSDFLEKNMSEMKVVFDSLASTLINTYRLCAIMMGHVN